MDEQTRRILDDPAFKTLLAKRSRLRWGLTIFLVTAYASYGLAGVWYPDAMAKPFFGTSMSWLMAIAYLIMLLSILTSLYYVRAIGKLHASDNRGSR